ncbi:hypothetical protein K3495_g1107 [Podosphaera aphanis]|nr:hypothetical protein K3495_g1107 [Podosphaera aphanis]
MNGPLNDHASLESHNLGLALNNNNNNNTLVGGSNLSSQIQRALAIVHNQTSSAESRKEASAFLEQVKTDEGAPSHGFTLASDNSQQPIVRHFALSLLEYAIKYKWANYSEEQSRTLQQWVMQLGRNIQPSDPVYLRNKTAQIWAEVAKRSSGGSWIEINYMAVELWNLPDMVHKEFVLSILEILSDDIFNKEDAISTIYANNIRKSCIEIFTPEDNTTEESHIQEVHAASTDGEGEGWLIRIGKFLDYSVNNSLYQIPQALKCMMISLSIYKSVMPWATSDALARSLCVYLITKTLALPNISIQIASVEALHGLYSRPHITDKEFLSLIYPTFTNNMVDIFRKLFEWSLVDSREIDDEKYLFAKKFSEMISILGNLIETKFSIIPKEYNVSGLLHIFLVIAQSPSLIVSIPALHVWTRFLRPESTMESAILDPFIAPLLELASSRIIRYDAMPEDSDDPSMIFLLEDIDTIPERHAFLGNYRRFNILIIELVVRQKPLEAIHHILGQADVSLRYLHEGEPNFCPEIYSKNSLHLLQIDAYLVVVDTSIKGYIKTTQYISPESPQESESRTKLQNSLEVWCERLLSIKIKDPNIKKRVVQIAVAFSISILNQRIGFMLKVLEYILLDQSIERPECQSYSQATKEMQVDGMYELQRLAMKMPNHLLDVYDRLEETVNQIIASDAVDKRRKLAFQSFLFTIIHRNTQLAPQVRSQKLQNFIEPVCSIWSNHDLDQALSSFDGFCGILGLDSVMNFLSVRKVHESQDWSLYKLDTQATAMQQELERRVIALPLQATKSFLQSTTDRLELGTPQLKKSSSLWKSSLPIILPNLYTHAVHNPENWIGLPPEMAPVVSRILSDRFWQAGISEGSKEEFYARVSNTKTTMEGLASSIRSSLRSVRESSYAILHCLSKFGEDFYGIPDLPDPLSLSLFADAPHLPSHQLLNLIQVVRLIIDNCPPLLRNHFIPPILSSCYAQLDVKCTAQWEKILSRQGGATPGENLTDEMKEESLLRQLTHIAVVTIAAFFDPQRKNNPPYDQLSKESSNPSTQNSITEYMTMRDFCITSPRILETVLVFMSHVIGMRDTRSCSSVLRIFRSIIPEFSKRQVTAMGNKDTEFLFSIREFICRDILMACVNSLNEPYFVELQRDLALCIVSIIEEYHKESTTPRQILLSIPNMQEEAVDKCLDQISQPTIQSRHQRALVLELLRDIKGVSISEQGRIQKPAPPARKERSKLQQQYMNVPDKYPKSPNLDCVADMFTEI